MSLGPILMLFSSIILAFQNAYCTGVTTQKKNSICNYCLSHCFHITGPSHSPGLHYPSLRSSLHKSRSFHLGLIQLSAQSWSALAVKLLTLVRKVTTSNPCRMAHKPDCGFWWLSTTPLRACLDSRPVSD